MGEKDIVTNTFFRDNRRFADIVNVGVFHGKRILQADRLESVDGHEGTLMKNSSKEKNRAAVGRFRDLLRKAMAGVNFILIGIENQWSIHYAMPVRIMGYDFLTYDSQLKKIAKIHKREKDLSGAEYVSGFSRNDRLHPVITVLIYYGKEPWDGPNSLFDIIDWESVPDEIREIVVDYPLHIVDVRRFENTEELETDVRVVFGFLQRQENQAELLEYIRINKKEFSDMEDDAYDMISVLADSEELMKIREVQKGKVGEHNMCKALDDMVEEAGAKTLILDNLEEGKTRECILEKLMRRFQLTKEQAECYYEKFK